jgi:hypothetical protein
MIQSAPNRAARRTGAVSELRSLTHLVARAPTAYCECGSSRCRQTVPAAAEAHRRSPDELIVAPEHRGADEILRAADRFFIVERVSVSLRAG